jgi:hypothetical protein
MYKSKEIRWFKNSSDKVIRNRFASQGQTFENTEPRTDYYLPLDKDDLTVKLREGNIEIMHRVDKTTKGKQTENAEGKFETWAIWCFYTNKEDKLTKAILGSNPNNCSETIKTRIGVTVTEDTPGDLQILPHKAFTNFGCQIEYMPLQIKSKTIYAFPLDWFRENERGFKKYGHASST